jgi:hypothetical protein
MEKGTGRMRETSEGEKNQMGSGEARRARVRVGCGRAGGLFHTQVLSRAILYIYIYIYRALL